MKTPTYESTPIVQTKYNHPDEYELDAMASQGVFSKSVNVNNHILEPMVSGKKKTTPSPNTETWNKYSGPKGSAYSVKGENASAYVAKGPNSSAYAVKGPNKSAYAFKGPNSSAYAVKGPNKSAYEFKGPKGNIYTGSINCANSPYGCCPDNETYSNADGTNCNPPVPPTTTAGCAGTQYGCCPDGVTTKNSDGSNCDPAPSSCATSQYGCCPDGVTAYHSNGSSCAPYPPPPPPPPACASTAYGCCLDGVTPKNPDGSNCSTMNAFVYNGPNISGGAVSGPNNSAYAVKGPQGNIYYGVIPNNPYSSSPYSSTTTTTPPPPPTTMPSPTTSAWQYSGPNVTVSGVSGPNNSGYVAQGPQDNLYYGTNSSGPAPVPSSATQIGGCAGTQYGCCPDNVTAKNSDGSNCSSYPPPPVQTNTVFIPPPKGLPVENSTYETTASYVDVPTTVTCPKPAPCPPCGRCPEPSFDCKKVPNYASTNSEYLPMPVLNDFSQFGM
jgi:hypothetical protein